MLSFFFFLRTTSAERDWQLDSKTMIHFAQVTAYLHTRVGVDTNGYSGQHV